MGIEPTSAAWEAAILPLNHARSERYPNKPAVSWASRIFGRGPAESCGIVFDQRCACYAVRLIISTEGCSESGVAYKDLREFIARLEKSGRTEAHLRGSGSGAGDYRDYPPRDARGRPGAALRTAQRVAHSAADQYARAASGACNLALEVECARGSGRAHSRISGHASAARAARQDQDAAEAGGAGIVLSEDREDRPVQGSDPARRLFAARVSDSAMLAAGCRAVHHLAAGVHAQSGDGQAQRGRLSHAGVRRAHHRHALADAKARRGTFSARARRESARAASTWPWRSAPTR